MKEHKPPSLFLHFFRWYCDPKLLSRIEGDLHEAYDRNLKGAGKHKADMEFVIEVFLLFRPGIIGTKKMYHRSKSYDMIGNYFKIAIRSLAANKFYNGLNLFGLTLGLSVGLLILIWVNDELNYDSFNKKADQIYRINAHLESSGNKFAVQVVQPTIATFGLKEVPGIQQAVRLSDFHEYSVFRHGDTMLKDNIAAYADPSLFKVFDYKLLKGSVNNPFPVTESVIVTQSAAKRFFGDSDPIGKVLLADNKDNFVVSGVMADFPENSWFKCDMLFSTALMGKKYRENGWGSFDEESWGNYGWVTFLQLQPGFP